VKVYSTILRLPGIALVVGATLIGRLPIGISGLAILLYVREVTGSYAAAGACAGALALGAAGAPVQGRLVDRRGEWSLLPIACVHAAGLLVVWLLGAADAPTPALLAGSFAAGLALPPLSSVLRSRWPYLLADHKELIPGAYALDSVLIEIVFVVGPLITTALVATVGPEYALIVSAVCVVGGTTLLLGALAGKPRPEAEKSRGHAFGLGALAAPGVRTLALASFPVGFAFGSIEVVLPAFSEAEGSREAAGLLIAVWAAAGAVAGLAYGTLARPERLLDEHLRLALVLPVGCLVLLAANSPATMAMLVIFAGAPVAPLVASRNRLVERVSLRGTATEAFTWPLTALVSGVSLGAAAAGALVESRSWTAGVVAAVVVSAVGAAVLLWRRNTLHAPSPEIIPA
jgi:MFS family permease